MSFIFLTMYYSHMADVNVGIITTIWSVQPMAAAVLDYFIYGEKLMMHHLFGILFIIASALSISLSNHLEGQNVVTEGYLTSPFLPGLPSPYKMDSPLMVLPDS